MSRRLTTLASVTALLALAVTTAVSAAATDRTADGVSLRLRLSTLHAGQQVEATLVNGSDATIEVAQCPILARRVDHRWETITRTHDFPVGCGTRNPVGGVARPHSSQSVTVEIYDDLTPGIYRVTVPYRSAGTSTTEPPFTAATATLATVELRVLAFAPGPPPHLSQRRILAVALAAAKRDGDGKPTLVQSAEGSRLSCVLVGTGDLDYAWNWSYLIAARGTFESPPIPTPVGLPTGPGPVRIHFTALTLVINARTGQITDSGSSDDYPKLARLGAVRTDRAS